MRGSSLCIKLFHPWLLDPFYKFFDFSSTPQRLERTNENATASRDCHTSFGHDHDVQPDGTGLDRPREGEDSGGMRERPHSSGAQRRVD